LGQWQTDQRKSYKKVKLSEERVKALEATEGWVWDRDEFEDNLEQWAAIYKKLGRTPSHSSNDADEKRSGIWQSNLRALYKKGTLSEERVRALEATEGWVWVVRKIITKPKSFEENLVKWVAKRTELGRTPSQYSKDADEKRLGKWQSQQRKYYKKGSLSKERIAALNAIEWWVWEATPGKIITKPKSFEDTLEQWAAKRTELGRTPSQNSKDADEKRLGQWQSGQRTFYKNKTLSKERVKALGATEGWVWESTPGKIISKPKSFEENLVQWAAKRTELGRDPSQHSKDADEKRLGIWQSGQRILYKKKKLPEERVKALNATDGWVWESTPGKIITKPKSFEENLVQWAAKRTELGRNPSQNSKDADEKRLGQWQSKQRGYYKNKTLSKERVKALEAIKEWVWSSR
jgi:hypothetical protein